MPHLSGFSDNPFRTRQDFLRAAQALIQPLKQYRSPEYARIRLATATGAGFDETAAQLEGFARPLWVVPNLINPEDESLTSWIDGLKAGTNPHSVEYWGDLEDFDQRMVEMESIAFVILLKPELFAFEGDEEARKNLVSWLGQINEHDMPRSNWLWFRVLVNMALVRSLGVALEEVKEHIDDSLRILDTFYLVDGWSSDGLWCDTNKRADYYSGSFAIQFAQLLFVRFDADYDPERTLRYKRQAREFAATYWRYFSSTGAAIPFGRSLTYRFAFAAFWAALAIVDVDMLTPLNRPGAIKGLLARHLRWWAQQPGIFNTDGTLHIGYTYPNMYLAEDYNSPQSVYWCLKAFVMLELEEHHPFWSDTELPYSELRSAEQDVRLLSPPKHILCNTPEHHFLLSSGQMTSKQFKAREAKYGKFAYSSAFSFSVPCGSSLEQIAPDSTLTVKIDGDDEPYKVRWNLHKVKTKLRCVGGREVPTLVSIWRPWTRHDITITTRLVPPVAKWPGWHIRIYRISWKLSGMEEPWILIDRGFAISAQDFSVKAALEPPGDPSLMQDTTAYSPRSAVLTKLGGDASGVGNLRSEFLGKAAYYTSFQSKAIIIRADPNTNLVTQRTRIPAIQYSIPKPCDTKAEQLDLVLLVTRVFAVEAAAKKTPEEMNRMWKFWPEIDEELKGCEDTV